MKGLDDLKIPVSLSQVLIAIHRFPLIRYVLIQLLVCFAKDSLQDTSARDCNNKDENKFFKSLDGSEIKLA